MPSLSDRPPDRQAAGFSARRLAVMAIFIALSAVGALVKIPSPMGTVGLDSAPGYFVAVAFGGGMGALVIAIGHLLTSAVVGFPFTLPVHLLIAAGMAVCALVFRLLGRRGKSGWLVAAVVAATLLNSLGVGLVVLPVGGTALYLAVIVPLLMGSAVNVTVAALAYLAVSNSTLLG